MLKNIETMKAEIDLMENAMYLVSNGRITKVRANDFGTDGLERGENGKT